MKVLEDLENKPKTFLVNENSRLYHHVLDGNFIEDGKSFENPIPTIIRDGEQKRICVFTFSDKHKMYPSVYFYDLESERELA